ncbi:MAG: PepSY domain-containing protein [Cytophagaceae bacterium]|nr:MAG: PepSY domain-containing protein [Cytophagaceae bacterium]
MNRYGLSRVDNRSYIRSNCSTVFHDVIDPYLEFKLMNLLGFFAIVIAVTGVVWLLQLFFQDKGRIDINLSVGHRSSSGSGKVELPKVASKPNGVSAGGLSILGDVVLTRSPQSTQSGSNSQLAQDESAYGNHTASTPDGPKTSEPSTDDAYIDQALADETFEDYTTESILKEDQDSIRTPALGQITLSPFASITDQLPAESFAKPQTPEQIEAMFELLRESTRRIEQQMMALYAVVRTQTLHSTGEVTPGSGETESSISNQGNDSLTQAEDGVNVYEFDDENAAPVNSFGSGLDEQLGGLVDEAERGVEYLTMEELGGELPADACKTYDLSEITEPVEDQPKELLPYLASLNRTGELSYDIVESIKKKEPTKVVRHRVRQLIRAIDHYRLNNDSNAAIRVTAVMSQLPTDLGRYAPSIYDIGRKFGLAAPEELAEPVEADVTEND